MPIQLRQQERTILPTTETGNVKANPNMLAGEFAAQRDLAGAIQQFGGAMAGISAKMYQVDVQREQNDFDAKENESQMAMRKFMMDNPDGDFEYDENHKVVNSKYIQEFNKRQIELSNYANSYKTKHGKEFATQQFNSNKPIRQYEVDAYSNRDRLDQAAAALDTNIQTIVNNEVDSLKYDFWKKQQEQLDPEKAKTLTPDDYKQALISGLLKNGVESRVVSAENAVAMEAKTAAIISANTREAAITSAVQTAQTFQKDGVTDMAAAQDYIGKALGSGSKEAQDALNRLQNWNQQEAINNEKSFIDWQNQQDGELQKLADNDQWQQIIEKTKAADSGIASKQSDQSKWKKVWISQAEDKLKGTDNTTDWETYKKIDDSLVALSKGNKKYEDVRTELIDSHKKLSSEDFRSLKTDLEAYRTGDKVLTDNKDYFDAIDDFQSKKFFAPSDERMKDLLPEKQYAAYDKLDDETKVVYRDNYSVVLKTKAKNEMEKWLKENPTATEQQKEERLTEVLALPAEEKSKSILTEWWNKKVITPKYDTLGDRLLGNEKRQTMPTIKNDADYNELSSGTEFIDPDGKRRRKL